MPPTDAYERVLATLVTEARHAARSRRAGLRPRPSAHPQRFRVEPPADLPQRVTELGYPTGAVPATG